MWFFSAKWGKRGENFGEWRESRRKWRKSRSGGKGSPAHDTEGYEERSTERDGHKVKANLYLTRQNDIN